MPKPLTIAEITSAAMLKPWKKEVDELRAALKETRDALKEAEWVQAESGEQKHCPICKRLKAYGHIEGCLFPSAIARADELLKERV